MYLHSAFNDTYPVILLNLNECKLSINLIWSKIAINLTGAVIFFIEALNINKDEWAHHKDGHKPHLINQLISLIIIKTSL